MNVGSKEKELHRLLEVLRIKAEIHVLVWDHISSLLTTDQSVGLRNEVKSHCIILRLKSGHGCIIIL